MLGETRAIFSLSNYFPLLRQDCSEYSPNALCVMRFSKWLVETGTISGLCGCQALFPVVFWGDSFLSRVVSSLTFTHQSSECFSGPADFQDSLPVQLSPFHTLPRGLQLPWSPHIQSCLFNQEIHQPLPGFLLLVPQPRE